MNHFPRRLNLFAVLVLAIVAASCAAKSAHLTNMDPDAPRSVTQAVEVLKTKWLTASDRDWILRNPQNYVVANLHLPFGTGVRNQFGLWGRNPELFVSCGVRDAEECSRIIFNRLWESVREGADPQLVRQLDCQFQLLEVIRIKYAGFYKLRIGEILKQMQEQIDEQLLSARSQLAPGCEAALVLRPTGEPDLTCWSRAEFSEDGQDPVTLDLFLGWISWRNGFSLRHSPPDIDLPFHEKCAWPKIPTWFQPTTSRDGSTGDGPHNMRVTRATLDVVGAPRRNGVGSCNPTSLGTWCACLPVRRSSSVSRRSQTIVSPGLRDMIHVSRMTAFTKD